MGDADRAFARRARTNPHAIPAYVETELTPPPQEPPRPETLRGYDSIPPPIQAQLEMLADGLGAVTAALGKVWDARKDGERLDRVDDKLASLAKSSMRHEALLDEFVVPMLKQGMKTTDGIEKQLERLVTTSEAVSINLRNLDNHVRKSEIERKTVEQQQLAATAALDVRITAAETRGKEHSERIEVAEREQRDHAITARALAKNAKKDKRRTGGLAGAIAVLVTAIAAVIERLI